MEFIESKITELYTVSSGLSKSADQFGFGYPFLSYTDVFHNYYVRSKLDTLVNSSQKEHHPPGISVSQGWQVPFLSL